MNGSLEDAIGLLAATALGVPLVLLPGYALGRLARLPGFRDGDAAPDSAAFVGLALLPLIDSLTARLAGLPVALAVSLALAAVGLGPALRGCRAHLTIGAGALFALWIGAVTFALIDFDTGTVLHQPLSVFDLVKHAALTGVIAEAGVPPPDPFFARAEPMSYYYFFYTPCALILRLGGGLLDGRAAFSGLVVWTGLAFLGMVGQLVAASGLTAPGRTARLAAAAVLLLMPAGGLDILLVLQGRLDTGAWFPVPDWLNEQVAWLPTSLIWVPHHVTGLMAGWLGLLVLADAADRPDAERRADRTGDLRAVLAAGAAFASCVGLSVWVCLAAVATAGAWLAWLVARRHWRPAGLLAAAGLVSGGLAALHLRDLLAHRDGLEAAVVPGVRAFGPVEGLFDEPLMSLVRLVLLPANYYFAFGVFAAGAMLFWRVVPRAEAHAREGGRLLTLAAGAGLLTAGFLRSAILNNDLGWRAVLFAQVPALVWSAVALARLAARTERLPAPCARPARLPARLPAILRAMPAAMAILLATGYATALYGFVQARTYAAAGEPELAFVNGRADIDRALREAYRWAGANFAPDRVLQADPGAKRVFDFGLYGRQRVAVADKDARLFGADPDRVAERLALVSPIFRGSPSPAAVRRAAATAGIDALVVTAGDPVWDAPDSWLRRARAAYAGPLVRIVRVEDIDD